MFHPSHTFAHFVIHVSTRFNTRVYIVLDAYFFGNPEEWYFGIFEVFHGVTKKTVLDICAKK